MMVHLRALAPMLLCLLLAGAGCAKVEARGLPAVTLEVQLLQAYYEERFDRGFEYAFVVPGMTRVVQAAGRLIRSAEDTGVIALLDRRFLRAPYRSHLPPDWLPPGGVRHLVGDPDEVARIFFVPPASTSIQ